MRKSKRFPKLRKPLQDFLSDGFWLHRFQRSIIWLERKFSANYKIRRWLAARDEPPPSGVSELYQFVIAVLALGWILIVDRPVLVGFTHPAVRTSLALLPTYFILELFIFSLVWIFAEKKPLESYRRSLGTYLFALIELGLLFSVVLSLASCRELSTSPLKLAYDSLEAIAFLQIAPASDGFKCVAIAHFSRIVGATIVLIIVASLVGKVIREDES